MANHSLYLASTSTFLALNQAAMFRGAAEVLDTLQCIAAWPFFRRPAGREGGGRFAAPAANGCVRAFR